MSAWVKRKIVEPVMAQLKSGATPQTLSLSFAFGITGGLFPVPGLTSVVCIAATVLLKLNPVIPQVVNLALTPIEIMCIPLFFEFGKVLLGKNDSSTFIPSALVRGIGSDFFGTLDQFKDVILVACFGWVIFLLPATALLYGGLVPILHRVLPKPKPVK
eukprot:CFRG1437T1